MTQLPRDFNHGSMSPELQRSLDAMRARYLCTGQANPPQGSEEAMAVDRGWWQRFWLSVARRSGR